MSRKVILYIASSLDGYIADENYSIDWLSQVEMVEEDRSYEDFYEGVDTVILGRKTYDQVVNELSPGEYPYEDKMSYIITRRPLDNRANKIFTDRNLLDLIGDLKEEEGGDIWIIGGSSIVQPLVRADLIDEYQICLIPILLGKGIPLFKEFDRSIKLRLNSVKAINEMVYTNYRRIK